MLVKGPFEFVSWWRLSEDAMDTAVARLASRVRPKSVPLIWRVYDYDQPANLSTTLAQHGFVAEPPETLMIFDLRTSLSGITAGADVRRAVTSRDVDDHQAVVNAVFYDDDAPQMNAAYEKLLDDPGFCLFTAYANGMPVAGGRLESEPGRQFGELFGGGVRPANRGQGLYRALVHARAEEAKKLGLRYLSTQAMETSRPILERMGFEPLARTVTWELPTKC